VTAVSTATPSFFGFAEAGDAAGFNQAPFFTVSTGNGPTRSARALNGPEHGVDCFNNAADVIVSRVTGVLQDRSGMLDAYARTLAGCSTDRQPNFVVADLVVVLLHGLDASCSATESGRRPQDSTAHVLRHDRCSSQAPSPQVKLAPRVGDVNTRVN
jgi:hypothetical protein